MAELASLIQVQPSPIADDVVFQRMNKHAHGFSENEQECALGHRVDEKARRQHAVARHAGLGAT